MKGDHQQNHQKDLKGDSQLKIIFAIIIALTTKVNQIKILIFELLKVNELKTKKIKYRATVNTLKKARKITKAPIVAIGGINSKNYKKLLLNKASFLAISGYIWKNKKIKPIEAIKKFV